MHDSYKELLKEARDTQIDNPVVADLLIRLINVVEDFADENFQLRQEPVPPISPFMKVSARSPFEIRIHAEAMQPRDCDAHIWVKGPTIWRCVACGKTQKAGDQ